MATLTPAQFKTRFPAFDSTADERVQIFIDISVKNMDESRWDDLYLEGLGLLTAHKITIADRQDTGALGASADDTTSQKAGDVSYTRDAGMLLKQAENPYMSTTYGQEYLFLVKQVGIGALSV
jgi:hypothetical protein